MQSTEDNTSKRLMQDSYLNASELQVLPNSALNTHDALHRQLQIIRNVKFWLKTPNLLADVMLFVIVVLGQQRKQSISLPAPLTGASGTGTQPADCARVLCYQCDPTGWRRCRCSAPPRRVPATPVVLAPAPAVTPLAQYPARRLRAARAGRAAAAA